MQNFFSKIFFPYLTQLLSHLKGYFLFCFLLVNSIQAQSVIDELRAVSKGDLPLKNQLFSETITTISTNRRIFITTNSNNKLMMGDFVSFIKDNQLILRALVVKTRDDRSGLKIVKVYDQSLWGSLSTGYNVQMLRGDDSYFLSQLQKEQEAVLETSSNNTPNSESGTLTADEQMILGADFSFEKPTDKARKINANHLVYATFGNFRSLGATGDADTYVHYRFGWGYQVLTNWWTDISYGYTVLKKYPEADIDTALNTITAKFGYIFELPIHSFIYAYGGLYNSIATSPGAGEAVSDAQAQQEVQMVRDVEGLGFLGGISFYKRLVPGWTFKVDLDLKNIGAGIMVEI